MVMQYCVLSSMFQLGLPISKGEKGGTGCWWAHYGGFWLSGRLKGNFHLTAPTAEPCLMGSTVQQAEEENPCVQLFLPFSAVCSSIFSLFPFYDNFRVEIQGNYFKDVEMLIFHHLSSGCISAALASISQHMRIDWCLFPNQWGDGGCALFLQGIFIKTSYS